MKLSYLIFMCLYQVNGRRKLSDVERLELCDSLECDESVTDTVCGIRTENGKNTFRLFDNECLLLKYGCQADSDNAYGIINIENCNDYTLQKKTLISCPECLAAEPEQVCGIRPDGDGFRIRIFGSNCEVTKHNCENEVQFIETDYYICEDHGRNYTIENNNDSNTVDNRDVEYNMDQEVEEKRAMFNISDSEAIGVREEKKNYSKVVVVRGSIFDKHNINATVNHFFAATHVLDMPLREMPPSLDENTRRRLVRHFGPVRVFVPWVKKPENVSYDYHYEPTLSTCFHKCPTKCPDTYAPVCGRPGNDAREPSLMFQNHCYMDVAQCKMYWEDKSDSSSSSTYIEASFLFCLGDTINGLYRFLPLIRTLQHMGRLKNKGNFKYKFRNMRFFNQLMHREFKPMG